MKVSFKGVKPGGAGGVYFLPGSYTVEIDCVKIVDKRKGGGMWVIETIIRESTNPDRRPGTRCNYTLNQNDDNLGIWMSAVMAINGLDPNAELTEETAAEVEALYEDNVANNSAKGSFCEIEAYPTTMKNGTAITAVRFVPIESTEKQAELTKKYKDAAKTAAAPAAAPAA